MLVCQQGHSLELFWLTLLLLLLGLGGNLRLLLGSLLFLEEVAEEGLDGGREVVLLANFMLRRRSGLLEAVEQVGKRLDLLKDLLRLVSSVIVVVLSPLGLEEVGKGAEIFIHLLELHLLVVCLLLWHWRALTLLLLLEVVS